MWKQLVDGELVSPDTWEVSLSSGKGKRESFERLIAENRLGGLALLRNLRLMQKAEVRRDTIANAIDAMRTDRVLPDRFITAAINCSCFIRRCTTFSDTKTCCLLSAACIRR